MQQFGQEVRRGNRAIIGKPGEMVEQAARTRAVIAREHAGTCRDQRTEPAQQSSAAFKADEGIVSRDLKALRQLIGAEMREHPGIDTQRAGWIGRKGAAHEHVEARQCQALGAAYAPSARLVGIAPLSAGAGIEKDADDGEGRILRARVPRHSENRPLSRLPQTDRRR